MQSRSVAVLAIAAVGALALTLASLQAQKPTAEPSGAAVDFARDIQPILQNNCYECHGPEKSRGHLRLDVRAGAMKGGETGAAIVPGKSEQSLMVRRILGLDGDDRMPKDAAPLAPEKIALVRTPEEDAGGGTETPRPGVRIVRDARLMEIGEGTSEVQRIVIAKDLARQAS